MQARRENSVIRVLLEGELENLVVARNGNRMSLYLCGKPIYSDWIASMSTTADNID